MTNGGGGKGVPYERNTAQCDQKSNVLSSRYGYSLDNLSGMSGC